MSDYDALELWKLLQPTWPIAEDSEAVIVNQWLMGTAMVWIIQRVTNFYVARPYYRSRLLQTIEVIL